MLARRGIQMSAAAPRASAGELLLLPGALSLFMRDVLAYTVRLERFETSAPARICRSSGRARDILAPAFARFSVSRATLLPLMNPTVVMYTRLCRAFLYSCGFLGEYGIAITAIGMPTMQTSEKARSLVDFNSPVDTIEESTEKDFNCAF